MRRAFALSLIFPLSFCAAMPDRVPPDTGWQPQDVNSANLILMAVRPGDLVRGRGSNALPPGLKAEPVLRLSRGRDKALLPSEIGDATASRPPAAPTNGAPYAGGQ